MNYIISQFRKVTFKQGMFNFFMQWATYYLLQISRAIFVVKTCIYKKKNRFYYYNLYNVNFKLQTIILLKYIYLYINIFQL